MLASARQLAAVPVATHKTAQGRPNSIRETFVERGARRVAVIGQSGASADCSASQTAGWTEAALSERKSIGTPITTRALLAQEGNSTMETAKIEIVRVGGGEQGEYRARDAVGAEAGKLTWVLRGGARDAEHTLVPARMRGQGVAAKLVAALIADAREREFHDHSELFLRRSTIRSPPRMGGSARLKRLQPRPARFDNFGKVSLAHAGEHGIANGLSARLWKSPHPQISACEPEMEVAVTIVIAPAGCG